MATNQFPPIPTPRKTTKTPAPKYTCLCCGSTRQEGDFYTSRNSRLWNNSDHRVLFCRDCVAAIQVDMTSKYGVKTAVKAICSILDLPYIEQVYKSVITNNDSFEVGRYTKMLNGTQYLGKDFATSLADGDLVDSEDLANSKAAQVIWGEDDLSNKESVIESMGYDPFDEYPEADRKYLYNDIAKYLGDDDVVEDAYKMSQILQIAVNNCQIRKYDKVVSQLDPLKDAESIDSVQKLKTGLVGANDKIAKENAISVKNRTDKEAGKSTLTYLMREMREKNILQAESNYYDQLKSPGTAWAVEMSMKAISQNAMFDENDKQEMFDIQRQKIQELTKQLDDYKEKYRVLLVKQNGGEAE